MARPTPCRWSAGSAPSPPPTSGCSPARAARCSTSAAGPAATCTRSRGAACSPSGSTCRRSRSRLARRRGAVVLEASIFDHVPGAGTWRCALLLDGNIGIGGRPAGLLRRVAALLSRDGTVLVECEAPGARVGRARLRLEHGALASDWFRWARVGVDAIDRPAAAAGLRVSERWEDGGRWFAALEPAR